MHFHNSSRYTLGVEIEFQTLDRQTLTLSPLAPRLLANAPALLKPRLAEELLQSILEIRTGVCFTLDDVAYDLEQTCCLAEELAREHDCLLHAASLHPFARVDDQILTDNERYRAIMAELQLVGRQFISQGFHVHVGLGDQETAIRVWAEIQPFLPLLLSLSASSPFYQGSDSGFASFRTKLFEMLPLAGSYNPFGSWQELQIEIQRLVHHGIIQSHRDLWWDARLNPGFGTLEVRVCDLPGRFSDILGLTALIQALVATLAEREGPVLPGVHDQVLQQFNKWQAARHGLQGRYIDPTGWLFREATSATNAVGCLLTRVQSMAVRLGCREQLETIKRITREGAGADRQRQVYGQVGDFKAMIRELNGEFWL